MNSLAGQFRISLLAAGDSESRRRIFEEIWRSYQRRIAVFVRYTLRCTAEESEDVSQEVMLRVYRNLHRYNPVYAFNGWIYTLARNCCIDWLRKNSVRNKTGGSGTGVWSETGPDPEQETIGRQLSGFIGEFVDSLEPNDRQAAYLRFYEGMRYNAIARVLGIPTGTVKYRIHVIRKRLKAALDERDEIRI